MLLIGQSNSDQSEPCKSDLKTTWRQQPQLYGRKYIANGCKTTQVASINGVTVRDFSLGKPCTSLAVDYYFGRRRHT